MGTRIPTEHAPASGMAALAWAARAGAYRPDPSRSIAGVMPTLLSLLGQTVAGRADLLSYLPAPSPRQAKRVLFLCVDALGFKELAQSQRLCQLYREFGTWVTSVFPTITSCALSSIYQALPPARHGITGHVIWKDFPGAVVDMLRMQVPGASAALGDAGFNVNAWKRQPGILDGDWGHALTSYHLLERHLVGSGLSTLIYGRTPLVAFLHPLEALDKARRMLTAMEHGWVGLYVDQVDTLSHVLTGEASQVGLWLRQWEESLAQMVATMPAAVVDDTACILVADHGQSTIQGHLPLHGEPAKWLEAHTRAVGHSGRVLHIYLEHGQEVQVRPWLQAFVGSQGRVFAFDEIKALTGPPLDGSENGPTSDGYDEWIRRSLGDLVVVLDDGWTWQHRPQRADAPPYESQLVSQHGALTWNEVFVPLLCAPLGALLDGHR